MAKVSLLLALFIAGTVSDGQEGTSPAARRDDAPAASTAPAAGTQPAEVQPDSPAGRESGPPPARQQPSKSASRQQDQVEAQQTSRLQDETKSRSQKTDRPSPVTQQPESRTPKAERPTAKETPSPADLKTTEEEATYGSAGEAWNDEAAEPSASVDVTASSAAAPMASRAVWQWLPAVNLTLILLLIAALIVFKQALRNALREIRSELSAVKNKADRTEKALGDARGLQKRMENIEATAEPLRQDLTRLVKHVGTLERRITDRDRGGRDHAPEPRMSIAREEPPRARGPVSVTDYMHRAERDGSLIRLEPDRFNDRVFNADASGFFFLVRGSESGDDYAIPIHDRFQTKQVFDTYYNSAYDCRVPGSGDVWVVRPACLRRDGDRWRLDVRGEIEVRPS